MPTSRKDVARALEDALGPLGFVDPKQPLVLEGGPAVHGAWVRKTWNTNRGVVLLEAPHQTDLAELGQALKRSIARQLGYVFFLYGIGLQLVWVASGVGAQAAPSHEGLAEESRGDASDPYRPPRASLDPQREFGELERGVDRIDNQWGIIQSVFCLDLDTGQRWQARSWGQVITGRFQDAIWQALQTVASER